MSTHSAPRCRAAILASLAREVASESCVMTWQIFSMLHTSSVQLGSFSWAGTRIMPWPPNKRALAGTSSALAPPQMLNMAAIRARPSLVCKRVAASACPSATLRKHSSDPPTSPSLSASPTTSLYSGKSSCACRGEDEDTAACTRCGYFSRNHPASMPGYDPPHDTHLLAAVRLNRWQTCPWNRARSLRAWREERNFRSSVLRDLVGMDSP
mmetsp:Transcript_23393/g.58508  ORF Transcript_23393/g.58508 Transcript_23393/m.58508 type:complete len:211 (+) Transcript_23393:567-1199(+)